MIIENKEKRKEISKWLIGVFTACILIYLSAGHMKVLADAISWLVNLVFPLLLGGIFALVFNVPMRSIEQRIFKKEKYKKWKRPIAITLSLVLVFGIFVGVAFLVIPELITAVKIVLESISTEMDQLASMEGQVDFTYIPFGEELAKIDIDWMSLKGQLQQWMGDIGKQFSNVAFDVAGTVVGSIVDFVVAIVFSIYILSNKEKLKRQVKRLIKAWLPERLGKSITHISIVCIDTFHHFITGQATEAIILGTLCTIGMLILGLPYAPTIGSLIGVTALVPYVGAYIGAIVGMFMIYTVNPFKSIVFIVFLFVLQQIEGNVIYPRVVGAKINLPAMWVLAAITVGGNLAGPVGMLLGVPIAASAYILLLEATENREKEKVNMHNDLSNSVKEVDVQ